MAEPPLHNTASAEHPDDIPPCNDAGSASTEVRGLGSSDAVAPVSLPLRQALRSPVAGAGPKMHDITEKFTRACNALDVGQLVKDEFFTLFESIGAIEIMDPKMDSGFLQPGETLEDDYDTLKPLLPEELIGIMDQLLCYEMAWHTGYPLSQTLFTSVYIDKLLWPEPKTLVQAQFYRGDIADDRRPGPLLEVLRAYCLALIKGCDFIIAKITGRDFFEEEDFCTHTYNRVLFVMVPMDVFMRELDAAIETMEDTDNDINEGLRLAIISRLHFRKDFLAALDLDCPLDYLPNYWPPIVQCISHIASAHQLGALVPGAFSTKMQRRLASTVPPRPMVELEFKDALEKLKQMCMDCEEATRFVNLPQDPLEYQSFLWAFSSRTPTPLAYARSYLSTLLFHPEILNSSVSLPLADVKALIFPSSPVLDPVNWTLSPPRNPLLPKPPRLQFALIIDDFVQSVGPPYLDLWVALGQNRCRLRRMLTHVIVSWDLLQGDASLLDSELVRTAQELNVEDQLLEFPLSTWVYHKKLWMIEKVILLGFEQDIYLPDEFAGMYLFLSLIATRRKELLRRIELHHVTRGDQLIAARNIIGVREIDAATPYLDSVLDTAEATSELASALYRFYTILLYLHLLPEPKRPFSSEELRYELRMKPFLTLNPPEAPPFPDFQAHLQPYGPHNSPDPSAYNDIKNPVSNLWLDIDANIKAAKDAFSRLKKAGPAAARAQGVEMAWVKEVQGGLASCVALGVAMAGVKSAVTDKDVAAGEALGIQVDVPEVGAGKRYAEGWVIGKVSKV